MGIRQLNALSLVLSLSQVGPRDTPSACSLVAVTSFCRLPSTPPSPSPSKSFDHLVSSLFRKRRALLPASPSSSTLALSPVARSTPLHSFSSRPTLPLHSFADADPCSPTPLLVGAHPLLLKSHALSHPPPLRCPLRPSLPRRAGSPTSFVPRVQCEVWYSRRQVYLYLHSSSPKWCRFTGRQSILLARLPPPDGRSRLLPTSRRRRCAAGTGSPR